MKSAKGFTLIEGFLILVIVGLLGGTGWYVWNTNNKTTDTFNNADAANGSVTKKSTTGVAAKDETASWLTFTSISKLYTIKLPDGWKFFHQDNDVLIANASEMLDKTGQIATITEVQGGRDGLDGLLVAEDPNDQSKERFAQYSKVGEIKAGALTGTKYTYEQKGDPQGIGMPKGGIEYSYYFVKNGKGIFITYTHYPNETSHLTTVEKMVSTLR